MNYTRFGLRFLFVLELLVPTWVTECEITCIAKMEQCIDFLIFWFTGLAGDLIKIKTFIPKNNKLAEDKVHCFPISLTQRRDWD